jgi:uncharacterized protein YcbK (DUF882 family)
MRERTTRRGFLRVAAGASLLLAGARPALAAKRPRVHPDALSPRGLAFANLHTGETLDLVYRERDAYLPDALASLDQLLRDHRTGEVHPIDPTLFDLLFDVRAAVGQRGVFEVISGYRSPATNQTLRSRSHGVAQRSLHLVGKAIDVRLRGVPTATVRRAALAMQRGGVGFYPGPDFVHHDTGRSASW